VAALTESGAYGRLERTIELDSDAFNAFLAKLDADRDRAGEKYETLRSQLVKFFECGGCSSPRALADETINRVARKILEGVDIVPGALYAYIRGVARNVYKEYLRNPDRRLVSIENILPSEHLYEDPAEVDQRAQDRTAFEQRLECLESCVGKLPDEARELIMSYYEGDEGVKIENHKRIAEREGISLNNLRVRVHRIREKLEECVLSCVEGLPN
jgi:RNA polymerase sigma factor (sigma-70 family)